MLSDAELQRWATDAACRDTVARAARWVDLKDYEAFAECFTETCVVQRPNAEPLVGRAALIAAYRARPAARLTRHVLGGTVVEVLGTEEAIAHSTVVLWVADSADAPAAQGRPSRTEPVAGSFEDRLKRGIDGQWRIADRIARFEIHAGAAA